MLTKGVTSAHPAQKLKGDTMDSTSTSQDAATAVKKAPPKSKPRPINPMAFSYTLGDAEAMTGLSVATLRRREKDGLLEFVRVAGRTLVTGDSLRRMVGAANAIHQK